jgi:hypothetical protein
VTIGAVPARKRNPTPSEEALAIIRAWGREGGKKGGPKGGKARWRGVTKAERSRIARKAARALWDKKTAKKRKPARTPPPGAKAR